MAIEHCIVGYLYFIVDVEQLVHVLGVVLHVVSLTNVADDSHIIAFAKKLQRSDSKSVSRL